jgi:hypothetical protein
VNDLGTVQHNTNEAMVTYLSIDNGRMAIVEHNAIMTRRSLQVGLYQVNH